MILSFIFAMKERDFQKDLIKELEKEFPGCMVLKNDSSFIQGVPDLTVLWEDHWATLECKITDKSDHRPNQDYYVLKMNNMSFSSFIYPENKDEVIEKMKIAWNDHSKEVPEGTHAFLSASKYSWLNYDDKKLVETYLNHLATIKGTKLHELASHCIKMNQKLEHKESTINMFVNDCIDLGLKSEQTLKYSDLCFGTADAIGLDDKLRILYVFDYKSGKHKASMTQLEIYAALFCLEYEMIPSVDVLGFELRIYQNDKPTTYFPSCEYINSIMDKIILADKLLQDIDVDILGG